MFRFCYFLEHSPLNNLEDDWNSFNFNTNADFIQPGLINLRPQSSACDDMCPQNMFAVPPSAVTCQSIAHLPQQPVFTNNILTELKPVQPCMELTTLPSHQVPTFSSPSSEASELANILTGGNYILEKRQEPLSHKTKEYFNNNQPSIKKSVIVHTPSFNENSWDNAITSKAQTNNLKRKHQASGCSNDPAKSVPSNANFAKLQKLVPGLSETSIKISKAAQLMKAADQIRKLKKENDNLQSEIDLLKASNDDLMSNITDFQNQLSSNGRARGKIP